MYVYIYIYKPQSAKEMTFPGVATPTKARSQRLWVGVAFLAVVLIRALIVMILIITIIIIDTIC